MGIPEGAIPFEEGAIPPPGYLLAQNPQGILFWVRPADLKTQDGPVSELTTEQVDRIRQFKEILGDHDPSSLEEAVEGFKKDRDPEREIRVWEQIARVYADELAVRPGASTAERDLLYAVVLRCSFSASVDDILATFPQAKALSDLQRVVQRFE